MLKQLLRGGDDQLHVGKHFLWSCFLSYKTKKLQKIFLRLNDHHLNYQPRDLEAC